MKRKSILRIFHIVSVVCLLVQLVAIHPILTPKGGVDEALADQFSQCTNTNIQQGRSFSVPGRQIRTVSHDEASLFLGSDALTVTTALTITPLRPEDVPALDQ